MDTRVLSDLTYVENSKNPKQTLDLYLPPTPGKLITPLLIFAHGGAWISGDKGAYRAVGKAWADQGIACAVLSYRLAISAETRHPAAAEDLARAIAWLAGQAAKYHFDERKIFVVGHSAGAHMAASVATTSKLLNLIPAAARPAGYVGIAGIYDIPQLLVRWPTYQSWFVETAFGKTKKEWTDASPTQAKLVAKSPWLLIHSKDDELVDLAQTLEFKKHLEKEGVKAELLELHLVPHFGAVQNLTSPSSAESARVKAFLNRGR